MSIEEVVKDLQAEVRELTAELHVIQRNQNSRRGPEGPIGHTGNPGPAGRDAVLVVKTDAKENVVRIFDENGVEKATIIPVTGPAGKDAAPARNGVDGAPGKDGRNAPTLDEIVPAVVAAVKARL